MPKMQKNTTEEESGIIQGEVFLLYFAPVPQCARNDVGKTNY